MKLVAAALALALPLLAPAAALADAYPSRPITMIVVFAAGGPTDVLARIVADHMGRTIGQRIVIENLAGAGGTTGGARGARAEPDGYTLTVGSLGSHGAAAALYRNIQYDARELEPIGLIAGTPGYFVVRKDFPAAHDAGVPGACEGEPRQGHERPCRRRLDAASRLPLPRASDRHEPRLDARIAARGRP